MPFLTNFLFPSPSVFVSVMSIITFVSMANNGVSEMRGRHLCYSKFLDDAGTVNKMKVSSRAAMLLAYSPAAAAAFASLAFHSLLDGVRTRLVAAVLAVHFTKRMLEVLFVHQYSGQMVFDMAISTTLTYFIATVTTIYSQHLTRTMAEPAVDLKYSGFLLFLIGISGNFYHHYLLSKLRSKGEKVYKIPNGGLFGLVVCPHYFFEIIGFLGIALISQTVYAFSFTLGSAVYLIGRSYATRKWYLSKFEDFPKDVKSLIPFVF